MRQKFNETLNRKPVELLSVHSRMRHAIFKVSCNQQYFNHLDWGVDSNFLHIYTKYCTTPCTNLLFVVQMVQSREDYLTYSENVVGAF